MELLPPSETAPAEAPDSLAAPPSLGVDSDPAPPSENGAVPAHFHRSLHVEEAQAYHLFGQSIEQLSDVVGKYTIDLNREKLGEGGEAHVYLAHEVGVDRDPVALKVLKPEHRGNRTIIHHFRLAAERLSRLDHPNIVRVLDRGRPKDDPPYVALQYVSGGSLAEHQESFANPREVAVLMLQVARAIQHAHERGVLHGDISPSNILLEGRKPMVTDFLAQRVGHVPNALHAGKFDYMCPEKAKGQGDTVTADTFSMGAVLYELLTGSPPIAAATAEEVVAAHQRRTHEPIRAFRGRTGVPYANLIAPLDALCRTALNNNPNQRYRGAQAFADNLERILLRLPTLEPQVGFFSRFRLWLARHPFLGSAAVLGALLLVVADLAIARSVVDGEVIQVQDTLRDHVSIARLQAQTMLTTFHVNAQWADKQASDERLVTYLETQTGAPPTSVLQELVLLSHLDSLALFDLDGVLLARYPAPGAGLIGRDFSFRDYHRCIQSLIDGAAGGPSGVCVSPVYRGESSRIMELSFGAVVRHDSGVPIGYVLLGAHTRRTADQTETQRLQLGMIGQTTTLFGPRGVDRADSDHSSPSVRDKTGRLTVVSHPALFGAEERTLDRALSTKLRSAFVVGAPGAQLELLDAPPLVEEHYTDPITQEDSLAAFAPVGATGFVIGVSTPRATALAPWKHHWDLLKWHIGLLNLGLVILGFAAVLGVRRPSLRLNSDDPSRRSPSL